MFSMKRRIGRLFCYYFLKSSDQQKAPKTKSSGYCFLNIGNINWSINCTFWDIKILDSVIDQKLRILQIWVLTKNVWCEEKNINYILRLLCRKLRTRETSSILFENSFNQNCSVRKKTIKKYILTMYPVENCKKLRKAQDNF